MDVLELFATVARSRVVATSRAKRRAERLAALLPFALLGGSFIALAWSRTILAWGKPLFARLVAIRVAGSTQLLWQSFRASLLLLLLLRRQDKVVLHVALHLRVLLRLHDKVVHLALHLAHPCCAQAEREDHEGRESYLHRHGHWVEVTQRTAPQKSRNLFYQSREAWLE